MRYYVCYVCCVLLVGRPSCYFFVFFFFNDTATTEIYTLSLHDALPICAARHPAHRRWARQSAAWAARRMPAADRKSTRLNSSHLGISYAVFCLKKKKKDNSPPSDQPQR